MNSELMSSMKDSCISSSIATPLERPCFDSKWRYCARRFRHSAINYQMGAKKLTLVRITAKI